jgi:hypothetical protein
MQTLNNSKPPALNGQTPTKGTIKYRIRFLRATFGDCLNTWPKYAQTEYRELARRLSQLENGGER